VTAEVRAWARERLALAMFASTVRPDETAALWAVSSLRRDKYLKAADAVLAVLPELLTDERIVEAVGLAVFAEVKKYPLPPPGMPDGSIGWGARPVDVGRAAGTAAGEALAGAS
jgi:hypothetical protein